MLELIVRTHTAAPAARVVEGVRTYQAGNTNAEVRALDGVTIDFATGRFTTVVGPSGSGKSTLLHCVAGLDRLTSGEVYLGDVELGRLSRRGRAVVRREQIGVVFQSFNLHPSLDVEHNIALPSMIAGRTPERDWIDELVVRLHLRDLLDRRPAELSGGEQQRVAAARALAGRPRLLLTDEPTGNLDVASGRGLLDILRMATDELGQTVILVTHDLAAACAGDTVVVLTDGRVVDVLEAPTVERLTQRMSSTT
ncbi:MAG TPA: ABC transporter ATP-binding protein [Acidimicrobiia bacterium]